MAGSTLHAARRDQQAAQELWQARKSLFFKPAGGCGSKAVYRGDKLTKGVWAEIIQGGYVAQRFVAPSERMVKLDGTPESRKTDVRLYVYNGQMLLTAVRLIRGKRRIFRTPGGGFAPVSVIWRFRQLSSLNLRPRPRYLWVDHPRRCRTPPTLHRPIALQRADRHRLQPARLQRAEPSARS